MSLTPGEIIDGKYRIIRMLGQGGMGAVYEGLNDRIRRRVAIKVLHPGVSAQEESVRRFEREAQATAQIGSDHICEVLDFGVLSDGTRYMVMEYLDGETLGSRLKRTGRLSPERMIPLMSQALDALGAAHAAGIIHRDLKPDNIFILPQKAGIPDFVKILDFGVSKFSQLSGDEMNVTRAGAVVGTPYYMSPEQARGGTVDQRSDVYALGVLLYQASTGQVPFQATTFNELLFKIVLEPAPPPQHFVPDMDPDFAAIIQRAMARDAAHRFQSCAEFKDALLAWIAARPALAAGVPALQSAITQRPQTQALPAMPTPSAAVTGFPGAPRQPSSPQLTPLPTASPFNPHTPQPSVPPQQSPSGSNWGNASAPAGLPVPQTSSSWADASGAAQPAKRPSKGPVIAIAVSAALLLGGGAAALFVLASGGGGDPRPAASAPAQTAETAAPTPPAPPPAETAKAADTAAPVETAAPVTTGQPAASATVPVASATAPATQPTWQPPGGTTYRPPTKPPTKPGGTTTSPKDPGY